MAIVTAALADGARGTAYRANVEATGVAPVSFAVTAGALPPGLTLDGATGAIAGTPTTAGSYAFTVEATDSREAGQPGRTASRAYTIAITPLARPCAPEIGNVRWLGDGEARVAWTPTLDAGCRAADRFDVEIRKDGQTRTTVVCTASSAERTCTAAGLAGTGSYRFRVRGVNDEGAGPWSEWSDSVGAPLPATRPASTGEALVTEVRVPGAGRIQQTATALVAGTRRVVCLATVRVRRAGTFTIVCALRRTAGEPRTARVRVTTRFIGADGTRRVATRVVRVMLPGRSVPTPTG